MQGETSEERNLGDEAGTGQGPLSRRDALKAAGLAGAAALSTGAMAAAQEADGTATAVQAKNPYGGVPSGGITLPPYYRPTPNLASNNVYYPGQEDARPRRNAGLIHRQHTDPGHSGAGRHLHHG